MFISAKKSPVIHSVPRQPKKGKLTRLPRPNATPKELIRFTTSWLECLIHENCINFCPLLFFLAHRSQMKRRMIKSTSLLLVRQKHTTKSPNFSRKKLLFDYGVISDGTFSRINTRVTVKMMEYSRVSSYCRRKNFFAKFLEVNYMATHGCVYWTLWKVRNTSKASS